MFSVEREERLHWPWVVRWDSGKLICRATSERDAKKIADALNNETCQHGDRLLTDEELLAIRILRRK